MYLSNWQLALIASASTIVSAQPERHGYKHRRLDWSDPALYVGVNWATVNYGQPAATTAPLTPTASPTTLTSPASPPQSPHVGLGTEVKASPSAQIANQASVQPATSGGGKRGLAYNIGGPSLDLFDSSSSITWAYNWDSDPGPLPSKYQFVPLLFSGEWMHTNQWQSNVAKATGPSKYLMSFNEPDMVLAVGGSQMDVSSAVSAFKDYMTPYATQGYKLGSPAVSNGWGTNPATGQPQGLDWLKPFLEQCSDCPISFAPVHWYGCNNGCPVQTDIDSFKSTVEAAISATALPVWITEFECLGEAETFLKEVLPWLDEQQCVERYSYFMVKEGVLTNNGALSQIGQTYGS